MEWSSLWRQFDAIYCINLKTREDRRQTASALFHKYNISAQFYCVEKHVEGGVRGCFESHKALMQKSCALQHKLILVLEDDIDVERLIQPQELQTVFNFIKSEQKCDMFYLGCKPLIWTNRTQSVTNYPTIYKVHARETHAYIVCNEQWMHYLANLEWDGHTEWDRYTSQCDASFALRNPMFVQRESKSDLSWAGSLDCVYQKAHKQIGVGTTWYSSEVNVPVYFMLVALLFVLTIVVGSVRYVSKRCKVSFLSVFLAVVIAILLFLLIVCVFAQVKQLQV